MFLKTLKFLKFGILGIRVLLKGKIFKKRRKKIVSFEKGEISLLTLKRNVKFIKYDIFTRAGTFNFKF